MIGALVIFYAGLTAAGYMIMAADKRKAERGQWRISERTLWLVSFAGGAWGSLLGMYKVRHKTKHPGFKYGMPLLAAGHAVLAIYLAGMLY
ncbi:DUF1294 domain-containing protein [Bacillus sp. SJS]|uniref:DUF1294 domain-containing protein n=1 Tax=Bacillus sp. SJS TaxID=1423321 RepID=UPI0004DD2503|nr:DUF1294 domain-containing protein [Bacillus sp. SJS]KZZ85926.1 hypothetical protein AS29_003100 [Bacillus sp. SJS]